MRVLIVGSGTTGTLIGARLAASGNGEVTYLVGPRRQLQLQRQGLCLQSPFGRFRRRVHAITAADIARVYDLIIICVRAFDFEAALLAAAPAVGPETRIVAASEGVGCFAATTRDGHPRMFTAVLEARIAIDADAIVSQQSPPAELNVGALRAEDASEAHSLADLLGGRGLLATVHDRIASKAFERFGFLAAAVATSVLMGRPLRDARRFAYGKGTFEALLEEAHRIGTAAGFAPRQLEVHSYRHNFLLESRPVSCPAVINEHGGRASCESAALLAEMIGLSRQHRCHSARFEMAWKRLCQRRRPAEPLQPPAPEQAAS